jgi:hypothetical protein
MCCDKSRPVGGWLPGGSGRLLTYPRSIRKQMAPGLRELIALSLLAGFGCGLGLAHGDLLFVAVFGGAIAMMINEAIRRFRSDHRERRVSVLKPWHARGFLSFPVHRRTLNRLQAPALVKWSWRPFWGCRRYDKSRPVTTTGGPGRSLNHSNRAYNGIQVDQGIARKAQQEPEGEMEGTETAAEAEAP